MRALLLAVLVAGCGGRPAPRPMSETLAEVEAALAEDDLDAARDALRGTPSARDAAISKYTRDRR
ncbi:MAG: hypothetical protein KC583_02615, partial [Myxococcales bacterium]|nr:hypothetical protein [Myxococcales bacterium]